MAKKLKTRRRKTTYTGSALALLRMLHKFKLYTFSISYADVDDYVARRLSKKGI